MWPMPTALALLLALVVMALGTTARPIVAMLLLFLTFQDPLQVLAGGMSTMGLAVKRADEVLILVLGLACLVFSRAAVASICQRHLLVPIGICYAGLVFSSIPPSDLTAAAVDLALFSKPFLLLVIGMSISIDPASLKKRLDPSLWVMLGCLLFGLVFLAMPQWQDAYAGDLRPFDERLGFLSAQGFFLGPGTYSWFGAATFAIAYAGYVVYKRSFYLVASILSASMVVLSWRRKSMIAIIAMILLSLLVRGGKASRARSFAILGLTVLCAATLLAPYVGALWTLTIGEYGSSNPYSTARAALYYTSVLIARDYFPLGTGLASFASHASKLYYSDVYREYGLSMMYGLSSKDSEYITDTFWPMVLGEGGVICLLGYVFFFKALVSASWRIARRGTNDALTTFLAMTSLLLLVGSLLESTASHIYGSSLQSALVLIPAGILWRADHDFAGRASGSEA
jgi:hypothetical protein